MTVEERGEVVTAVFEALSSGDPVAAGEMFETNASFDFTRSRGPNKGMFHGRTAIVKNWKDFLSIWDSWLATPHDYVEAGEDEVLFSIRGQMKGRDGIELNVQAAGIWQVGDGQVVRATFFQSRDDALAAAGLPDG